MIVCFHIIIPAIVKNLLKSLDSCGRQPAVRRLLFPWVNYVDCYLCFSVVFQVCPSPCSPFWSYVFLSSYYYRVQLVFRAFEKQMIMVLTN